MSNDTQKPAVSKESGKDINAENLVVNQITIRSVNRTSVDIGTFRSAHIVAESVLNPNRTRLYDLYEDIRLDGHLSGVISKRLDAVLNKTLHFEKAGKLVEEMEDVIESEVFRDIITKIMEVKLYGLSGLEFVPGKELRFEEIPRKHIKPHKGVIALEQTAQDGVPYNNHPFIWVIEKKNDLGLLLKCAPYAIWKRGDLADWAQYIEIFGQPVRIMKYDAYDPVTKMELQQVVDEAGSSLALLIPKQADFEMKDGKQSNGNGELQEKLMNACNNEMSVIILGNTETTSNSNGGSNAKAKEHGKQQDEVTKSDLKFVANMLNQPHFISILKSYGLPVVDGGRFKHEKEVDVYEVTSRLNMMAVIAKHEPINPDDWYNIAGLTKPENYAEAKAEMTRAKQVVEEIEIDEDEETPPTKPAKSGNKGERKKKTKVKLSAGFWDAARLKLADFFAPAHKD